MSDGRSAGIPASPQSMSTMALVRESLANATLLAKRQIDLFRLEAMEEMRSELNAVVKMASAGLMALLAVSMLLFAGASGRRRYPLPALQPLRNARRIA